MTLYIRALRTPKRSDAPAFSDDAGRTRAACGRRLLALGRDGWELCRSAQGKVVRFSDLSHDRGGMVLPAWGGGSQKKERQAQECERLCPPLASSLSLLFEQIPVALRMFPPTGRITPGRPNCVSGRRDSPKPVILDPLDFPPSTAFCLPSLRLKRPSPASAAKTASPQVRFQPFPLVPT